MTDKQLNYWRTKKTKIYYLLHFFGWYVVALGNEYLGLLSFELLIWEDFASSLLSISLACCFTHFYRLFLHQIAYFSIPKTLYHLFVSFLGSSLLLATLVALCDTLFEWWFFGANYFNWIDFSSLLLNTGRYIAMWLLLYFFYQYGLLQLRQNALKIQAEKALVQLQSEISKLSIGAENWEKIFPVLIQKIESDPHLARQLVTDFSAVLRDFLNYKQESLSSLKQEIEMLHTWLKVAQFYLCPTPELIWRAEVQTKKHALLPNHALILLFNFILQEIKHTTPQQAITISIEAPNALCICFYHTDSAILQHFEQNKNIQNIAQWIQISAIFESELSIRQMTPSAYTIQIPLTDSSTL
ncbi:MAG: hypothetical protein JJT94_06645 [Bernardetiaceae bacterium]|nr:hypothetical protein [Bernardetiaceae bacterium]